MQGIGAAKVPEGCHISNKDTDGDVKHEGNPTCEVYGDDVRQELHADGVDIYGKELFIGRHFHGIDGNGEEVVL